MSTRRFARCLAAVSLCGASVLTGVMPAGAAWQKQYVATGAGNLTTVAGIAVNGSTVAWMQDLEVLAGSGQGVGDLRVRRPNGMVKSVEVVDADSGALWARPPFVVSGRYVVYARTVPTPGTPGSWDAQLCMYDAVADVGPTVVSGVSRMLFDFSMNGTVLTWVEHGGGPADVYRAGIFQTPLPKDVVGTNVTSHDPVTLWPSNGSGPYSMVLDASTAPDRIVQFEPGSTTADVIYSGIDGNDQPQALTADNDYAAWTNDNAVIRVFEAASQTIVNGWGADVRDPVVSVRSMALEANGAIIQLWDLDRRELRDSFPLDSGAFQDPALAGRHLAFHNTINHRVDHYYYDVTCDRINGSTRYDVAVTAARKAYPSLATISTVVIASGADAAAADPLAAAGLCWKYDAPLLLVNPSSTPGAVRDFLKEIDTKNGATATKVIVVGGPASVPDARLGEMKSIVGSGNVERLLSTGNRYDMAKAIAVRMKAAVPGAKTFPADPVALVANGADSTKFFDALALSAVSRATGFPILLVGRDVIPAATQQALGAVQPQGTVIAGGTASVSAATYSALHGTSRWAGPDRYATAVDIADNAIKSGYVGIDKVAIAAKLPDGLTGGAMIGRVESPHDSRDAGVLLIAQPQGVPTATQQYLKRRAPGIWDPRLMGGTTSLSSATAVSVNNLLDH